MTNFERIKNMSIYKMASYFEDHRVFPYSPCYLCPYDEGMHCVNVAACTKEHRTNLYLNWLKSEV